jgi:hypothetical protein
MRCHVASTMRSLAFRRKSSLDRSPDGLALMRTEMIHSDNVTRLQGGNQESLTMACVISRIAACPLVRL